MAPRGVQGYPDSPRNQTGLRDVGEGRTQSEKSWPHRGPFQKQHMAEVGHFLVEGKMANLDFRGGL